MRSQKKERLCIQVVSMFLHINLRKELFGVIQGEALVTNKEVDYFHDRAKCRSAVQTCNVLQAWCFSMKTEI